MKVSSLLKEQVVNALQKISQEWCQENGIAPEDFRIRIEYSRDEKFGDYSSPVAMENKKHFSGKPLDLASELKSRLLADSESAKIFQNITVTPPGFINFRIAEEFLAGYALSTIGKGDFHARLDNPEKINLEFVSANPTGPLNIVSARAAAYGDCLASVMETLGHRVEREFYVNDYGNQVQLLGVACLIRYQVSLGAEISFQEEEDGRSLYELIESNTLPKESYRGEYIKEILEEVLKDATKLEWINGAIGKKSYDEVIDFFARFAVQSNLSKQKEDLKNFGVEFDRFFSERSLHESGKVLESLQYFTASNTIYEEDGKQVFRSTDYSDDKDRVVVRDDGRPTYLLADIAYHKNKMDRGYDRIIDIWGPDHHGYIARLAGAMQAMGYPAQSFRVIICQQVNLLEDGKKVKMSKRLGNFQRMRDLIHYLGQNARDVGRYFFITRTAEAPLDFDLDLAKDESDKNPVFYLQYAHARIASIFREVGEGYAPSFADSFDWTEERARLLFWIARYPEEVYDAATHGEPHRIANYLQFLAKAFTKFYGARDNRLKSSDETTRLQLALLCRLTQAVLKNGLQVLGISAPDRMQKED